MNKICMGCGIELQDKNQDIGGYVNNLEKDLCQRCFKLKHYGEYKQTTKNNEDYEKILASINPDNLVLYVCDIFTLNLDNLKRFKKVILVLTKRDVLPKSVKDEKIIKYIKNKYNNLLDIEIISSIHNYNLDSLYNKIIKYNNSKPIYLVGHTNSGKSSLLNKIIKNYSNQDINITTSMYPSTTLDKIEIKLNDNITLIDTPGLINENSIINKLPQKELKKYNIKKEVKPRTFQIKDTGSILIDNLIRIDYKTNIPNSITFYINNGVLVKKIGKNNEILKESLKKSFKLSKDKDLVIDDICFLKFVHEIDIDIYLKEDINIRRRDNLI